MAEAAQNGADEMERTRPAVRTRVRDIERFLHYVWRFKLTFEGKVLVAGGVAIAAIAMRSVEVPIIFLLLSLFLVGAASLMTGFLYRPALRINGNMPDRIGMGESFRGVWEVRNVSRRLHAYDVSIGIFPLPAGLALLGEPPSVPDLAPGENTIFTMDLRAIRRGCHILPGCRAFTRFPFGVCRSGSARSSETALLVTPSVLPLELPEMRVARRYQPGGIALTSSVGESMEYIGNREYREGDSFRRIDFRGWARLAKPVVREYLEEYYCRIALVLDTEVSRDPLSLRNLLKMATGKESALRQSRFEAAVNLTAAIAAALSQGEFIIDIFAAGPRLYVFRAGRHLEHLEQVYDVLAGIESCPSNPFLITAPAIADELPGISTLICVLTKWDTARRELVRMASEAGCEVCIFFLDGVGVALPEGIDPEVQIHMIPLDTFLAAAESRS